MPVTELVQGEVTHRWPQILPGAKAVMFTANTTLIGGFDGAHIDVVSLEDRRRKTLQRDGTFGRYLPSGHLIYMNRGLSKRRSSWTIYLSMAGCIGQEATAPVETRLRWEPKPIAGRPAAGVDDHGRIDGRLDLRMAAGHHDAPDFRWRI